MSNDSKRPHEDGAEHQADERASSWDEVASVIGVEGASTRGGRAENAAPGADTPRPAERRLEIERPESPFGPAAGKGKRTLRPDEAGEDELAPPTVRPRQRRPGMETIDADGDVAAMELAPNEPEPRSKGRSPSDKRSEVRPPSEGTSEVRPESRKSGAPERKSSLELLRPSKPAGPFGSDTPAATPPRAPSPDPLRAAPTRVAPPFEAPGPSGRTREISVRDLPVLDEASRLGPGDLKFVIEQGLSINKEFLVSDAEMLIGRRDPDQDFIPDIDLFDQETATNRYISRRQARLFFKDGRLWVEDLESSNGTAVNNRLIPPQEARPLKPGDKLLLGQSVLLRLRVVT